MEIYNKNDLLDILTVLEEEAMDERKEYDQYVKKARASGGNRLNKHILPFSEWKKRKMGMPYNDSGKIKGGNVSEDLNYTLGNNPNKVKNNTHIPKFSDQLNRHNKEVDNHIAQRNRIKP